MKWLLANILIITALGLMLAGCSSTSQQQSRSGMARSPEYYQTYGPGSEEPPDYGPGGM